MASDRHEIAHRRGRAGRRRRHAHEIGTPQGPASAGRLADGAPRAGECAPARGRHGSSASSRRAPDDVAAAFAPHPTAVQRRPRGTGDATKAALAALKGHRGPVLVVYADAPLLTTATLQRLVAACRKAKAAVGVLGFVARDPTPYGRLIMRRRRAGEDRREPRCRREREGDRFLQFRRDVPRRRADRLAAGRDPQRQRQERVLSHRRRRHRARRGPRAPSPSKARRRSSRASIRASSWRRPSGPCSSACARRRSRRV